MTTTDDKRPVTSRWARKWVARRVEDLVLSGNVDKELRSFLHPTMNGTQGYLIAHILNLGGYLDEPAE